LEDIHDVGIKHYDVKPENILYAGNLWKFTDFGLSDTTVGTQIEGGTPKYMAPEQVDPTLGEKSDKTDVWQAGIVIFQLLSGHLPYSEAVNWRSQPEVRKAIAVDGPVLEGIPGEYSEILIPVFNKDSRERPNAKKLRQELKRVLINRTKKAL